jgi:hypothetical protein
MLHSFLCIHKIYLCIHAIGVLEGLMLLQLEGAHQEEEQEQPEEPEVLTDEGVPEEELLKCPDHRPSSFLKGKPRCMLTPIFVYISFEYFYLLIALSCRS